MKKRYEVKFHTTRQMFIIWDSEKYCITNSYDSIGDAANESARLNRINNRKNK